MMLGFSSCAACCEGDYDCTETSYSNSFASSIGAGWKQWFLDGASWGFTNGKWSIVSNELAMTDTSIDSQIVRCFDPNVATTSIVIEVTCPTLGLSDSSGGCDGLYVSNSPIITNRTKSCNWFFSGITNTWTASTPNSYTGSIAAANGDTLKITLTVNGSNWDCTMHLNGTLKHTENNVDMQFADPPDATFPGASIHMRDYGSGLNRWVDLSLVTDP